MSYRAAHLPLLPVTLLVLGLISGLLGCGKANPVAPSGSTVTLSANPSELTSPTGTSTITAVVRKPNGTVAAGVEVRFTASLGTIDTLVATNSGGIATATLRGDGRSGTATVNAAVDGGATATALMVPIGGGAKTIFLQAVPASISAAGGTAQLVALVRDATGQPAAGVLVNFITNVGRVSRLTATTNTSGEATTTLIITPSDVTNQTSVSVSATAVGSDGTPQTAMATVALLNPNAAASISVSANPGQISVAALPVTITLRAVVLNSQGLPLSGVNVFFSSTLGKVVSTGAQPTDNNGIATDTLQVNKGDVPAGTTQFTVTAQVPGAGGVLISGTTVVNVSP